MKQLFLSILMGVLGIMPFGNISANEDVQKAEAIFAGGCFWCMEASFSNMDGVFDAISGYSGGNVENPTYEAVVRGSTGHAEAVKVVYDPHKVSYKELLSIYWDNVDPTDDGGQFCDRGSSYRPVIFVQNEQERNLAEKSKKDIAKQLNDEVKVSIEDFTVFYEAGADHQDFHEKNPLHYFLYRKGCGQDRKLEELRDKRGITQ